MNIHLNRFVSVENKCLIRKISIVASSRLTEKEIRLFRGNVKDGPSRNVANIGKKIANYYNDHLILTINTLDIPRAIMEYQSICNRIPRIYLSWNRSHRYHFYLFILFPMQMLFRSCSVQKFQRVPRKLVENWMRTGWLPLRFDFSIESKTFDE